MCKVTFYALDREKHNCKIKKTYLLKSKNCQVLLFAHVQCHNYGYILSDFLGGTWSPILFGYSLKPELTTSISHTQHQIISKNINDYFKQQFQTEKTVFKDALCLPEEDTLTAVGILGNIPLLLLSWFLGGTFWDFQLKNGKTRRQHFGETHFFSKCCKSFSTPSTNKIQRKLTVINSIGELLNTCSKQSIGFFYNNDKLPTDLKVKSKPISLGNYEMINIIGISKKNPNDVILKKLSLEYNIKKEMPSPSYLFLGGNSEIRILMYLRKITIDSVRSTLMGKNEAFIIIRLLNSSLEIIIAFFYGIIKNEDEKYFNELDEQRKAVSRPIKKFDKNLFEDPTEYVNAIKDFSTDITKETIQQLKHEIIFQATKNKDFITSLTENKILNILNKLNYAAKVLNYYSKEFTLLRNTNVELLGKGTIGTVRHHYIPGIPKNNEVIKNINPTNNINMKFYGKRLIPEPSNIASTTSKRWKAFYSNKAFQSNSMYSNAKALDLGRDYPALKTPYINTTGMTKYADLAPSEEKIIRQRLEDQGWYIYDIATDGNCFVDLRNKDINNANIFIIDFDLAYNINVDWENFVHYINKWYDSTYMCKGDLDNLQAILITFRDLCYCYHCKETFTASYNLIACYPCPVYSCPTCKVVYKIKFNPIGFTEDKKVEFKNPQFHIDSNCCTSSKQNHFSHTKDEIIMCPKCNSIGKWFIDTNNNCKCGICRSTWSY